MYVSLFMYIYIYIHIYIYIYTHTCTRAAVTAWLKSHAARSGRLGVAPAQPTGIINMNSYYNIAMNYE